MLNRFWNRHKQLADRLRREASDARPAFSAGLHEQIMKSVRADMRVERSGVRRLPHWTWAVASAAVVLISVSAAFWGLPQADRPANSREIAQWPIEPATIEPATIVPDVPPAEPASEESLTDARETDGFDAVSELFKVAADQVESIQKAETSVESDLVGEQLAMLDHDARIVAGWLIDPITATLEN
jgi:hypothetical protein